MDKTKAFTGLCPVHDKESIVTARLSEINSTGSLISSYALGKILKCSIAEQCPLKKCPVVTI